MNPIEGLSRDRETAARAPGGQPAALASETASGADRVRARQRAAERFWRDVRLRRMLAFADLGAGAVASLLVAGSAPRAMWALALLPGWVVIAKLFGLYDRDQRSIRHLTVDELSAIAAWAAAGTAMLGLLLPLTPVGDVSFGALVGAWLAATVVAGLVARGDAPAVALDDSAGADGGVGRRRAGLGRAAQDRAVRRYAPAPGRRRGACRWTGSPATARRPCDTSSWGSTG